MKNGLHIKLWSLILFTSANLAAAAQDIHFSQFFEAPLLRNPALAGVFTGDLRVQSIYRTQWQSVTTPYQTVSLSGEYKLPVGKGEDYMTIGGQILYDRAGTVALTSTHVLPVLNYHKSLSADRNMYLSLGFMGGIVQRRFDRSKMTTNSQFDGTGFNAGLADGETMDRTNYSYFDGTAGLSFNTQLGEFEDNNLFVGISYHHFNKAPKVSFYGNTAFEMIPKWVYSAGLRVSATDDSYITFHGDYSKQGPHTELIGGAMYTYKLDDIDNPKYLIHGGAFMRWRDAIIPMVKLEMRPLAIIASYDANTSALSAASRGRGGFELGISYQTFLNKSNSSIDAVRCPKF